MDDEKRFDALRMKDELGERVSRALVPLIPEERIRWIREEAAKYRRENPVPPRDSARKSA